MVRCSMENQSVFGRLLISCYGDFSKRKALDQVFEKNAARRLIMQFL